MEKEALELLLVKGGPILDTMLQQIVMAAGVGLIASTLFVLILTAGLVWLWFHKIKKSEPIRGWDMDDIVITVLIVSIPYFLGFMGIVVNLSSLLFPYAALFALFGKLGS